MKRILLLVVFLCSPCFAAAVAQWKMNDNTTNSTVVDSVGSNTGTFVDATGDPYTVAHSTTGKIYGALTFDGSDDYVDTGDTFQSTFRDSFSISLWFRADDGDTGISGHIFSTVATSGGSGNRIRIFMVSGKLFGQYIANSNQVAVETGVLLSDGQTPWHHIVVTVENGGVASIYFDGVLEDTADASGVTFNSYTNAFNPFIGARNNAGTDDKYFDGNIDNVIIYDRALTLAEVKTLYSNSQGTEEVEVGGNRKSRYTEGYRSKYRNRYN